MGATLSRFSSLVCRDRRRAEAANRRVRRSRAAFAADFGASNRAVLQFFWPHAVNMS